MKFRNEFFIALNLWQNGWSENQDKRNQLAIELKKESELLDEKYKIVDGACYRKRFIYPSDMLEVIWEDHKVDGITSWTTDISYAEFFKGKFRDGAVTAAIFECNPEKHNVIINLNKLWACNSFIEAIYSFNEIHPDHCVAIYNFNDSQKEVILDVPLRGSQICVMSGVSSSFDAICDLENIPESERPKRFKQLIDGGACIEEVTYIKKEAAIRAVQNTKQKFAELLESFDQNK